MSDPIDPTAPVERRARQRRRADRREGDRRSSRKLPVPVTAAPAADEDGGAAAAFAAQLIGQDGAKRGLRGGTPVLEQARSAYLEAEWLGPADRRRRPGRSTKTDV